MHFSTNLLGYVAAFAVFATFMLKEMLTLRLMAITSNFLFVGYALLAGLEPILVLHAMLIPVNAMRLAQVIRDRRRRRGRLRCSEQCAYQLRRVRRGAWRQTPATNAEPARLLGIEP